MPVARVTGACATAPPLTSVDSLTPLRIAHGVGVNPASDTPYDEETVKQKAWEVKEALLTAFEDAADAAVADDGSDPYDSKTVFRVISNVQVEIGTIHIRFEDLGEAGGNKIAAGITLQGVSVRSAEPTGEGGAMAVVPKGTSEDETHKKLVLKRLGVYFDVDFDQEDAYSNSTSPAQYIEKFQQSFGHSPPASYLVLPITSEGVVTINKKVTDESGLSVRPRHGLNVDLGQVAVVMNSVQYRSMLQSADYFAWMALRMQYRHLRPARTIAQYQSTRGAAMWWRFALNCLLVEIKRKSEPWSWRFIRARRDTRKRYIGLYMDIYEKGKKKVPPETTAEAEEMEKTMDIEDIKSYRRMGRARVKAKPKPQKKSWFWSSSKDTPQQSDAEQQAAQLKAFQEILSKEQDYEDSKDPGWVQTAVALKLGEISVTLQEHVPGGKSKDLLFVKLEGTTADIKQRNEPGCIDICAGMSTVSIEMRREDGVLEEVLSPLASAEAGRKFMALDINTKPITPEGDVRPDVRVRMNLGATLFQVSAPGINSVSSFFEGVEAPEAIDVQGYYDQAVGGIVEQGRAGLSHAVENQQKLDLEIKMAAPRVVIPAQANANDDTLVVIADLGSLSLDCKPNDNNEVVLRQMSDSELEARSYETFNIKVYGVQILLAKKADDYAPYLDSSVETSQFHIIEKITLNAKLKRFLSTNTTTLAQFRVFAELPSVAVCLTDVQLGQLLIFGDQLGKEFADEKSGGAAAADSQKALPATATSAASAAQDAKTAAAIEAGGVFTEDYLKRKAQKRLNNSLLRVADLDVILKSVSLKLKRRDLFSGDDRDLLQLSLINVGMKGFTRKWDQNINVFLNGFYIADLLGSVPNYMLLTLNADRTTDKMDIESIRQQMSDIEVPFINVDAKVCDDASPLFASEYSKVKMLLGVASDTTELWVDQTPTATFLEEIDRFVSTIHSTADPVINAGEKTVIDTVGAQTASSSAASAAAAKNTSVATIVDPDVIDVKITARVESVRIVLAVDTVASFEVNVAGVAATVNQKVRSLSLACLAFCLCSL